MKQRKTKMQMAENNMLNRHLHFSKLAYFVLLLSLIQLPFLKAI